MRQNFQPQLWKYNDVDDDDYDDAVIGTKQKIPCELLCRHAARATTPAAEIYATRFQGAMAQSDKEHK